LLHMGAEQELVGGEHLSIGAALSARTHEQYYEFKSTARYYPP
jgi:hypothetical protein